MLPIIFIIVTAFMLLIQAFFYILPAVAMMERNDVEKSSAEFSPVSVIIASRNELQNLKLNLQYIVNQKYPEFEIVIVDDNSTDGTFEYVSELSSTSEVPIKVVRNDGQGKKSALSTGIRMAKYEHLIFTDADCRPSSEHWIAGMMSCMNEENPLVLGYGELSGNTFAARFSSYDAALIALQYLGFASLGHAYMGVGRNIAYTKKLWDTLGGFESHSDLASGDDDLFVAQAARHVRPTVCVAPQAKTVSPAKESLGALLRQKTRHVSTSTRYSLLNKFLSGGEIVSRALFFAIVLAFFFVNWKIALAFLIARLLIVVLSTMWFCKKIKTGSNLFMLLIFDIFAPIFYVALMFYKFNGRNPQW